jgi:hypothetical protein
MAEPLVARPFHAAYRTAIAATPPATRLYMQGQLSTHAIAFPAANSPQMSVIKLTVNPQLHVNLMGYPAVNAFEQVLEAAGIPSSLPLRFLQQKGKGPDQDITEAEFDHFLTHDLRIPAVALPQFRAMAEGMLAPHLVIFPPEMHPPMISLSLVEIRARACAARDNIEAQPYPVNEDPEQAAAAAQEAAAAPEGGQGVQQAAAAATAAPAAAAAAQEGQGALPGQGAAMYRPTKDQMRSLAIAIADAQGLTHEEQEQLSSMDQSRREATLQMGKLLQAQRAKERVLPETLKHQGKVWKHTRSLDSFKFFVLLAKYFNSNGTATKGFKPCPEHIPSTGDPSIYVCIELNNEHSFKEAMHSNRQVLTTRNLEMDQQEEEDPDMTAVNKPERAANNLALVMMSRLEIHLHSWSAEEPRWGVLAMRIVLCAHYILARSPVEGNDCLNVVPDDIFRSATSRYTSVKSAWEPDTAKRGGGGANSSSNSSSHSSSGSSSSSGKATHVASTPGYSGGGGGQHFGGGGQYHGGGGQPKRQRFNSGFNARGGGGRGGRGAFNYGRPPPSLQDFSQRFCANCGTKGHNPIACPSRHCSLCGQQGHMPANCFSKGTAAASLYVPLADAEPAQDHASPALPPLAHASSAPAPRAPAQDEKDRRIIHTPPAPTPPTHPSSPATDSHLFVQLPASAVRVFTHTDLASHLAGHIDSVQMYRFPHQWRTPFPHANSLDFSVAEQVLRASSSASSSTSTCPTAIARQINRQLWALLDPATRPSDPKYE